MKKREPIHSFVLLFVLVIAIGAIFLYSNLKFTGYATFGEYTNQSSCEAAGHTWEIINNETCTDISGCTPCTPGCVTEYTEVLCGAGCQADCTNITNCTPCTPGCVTEYTEVLCGAGCLETCQTCETILISEQCVGDVCDSSNLDLCLDETTCTTATGYWYDSVCNAQAQCVPTTCSALGRNCGSVSDGCSGTLNCGSCNSGYTCSSSGTCQVQQSETEAPKCGNGNCGVDEDCLNCPSDCGVCISGAVVGDCVPNWECGEWQECIDNNQIRICNDLSQCDVSALTMTESQSCVSPIVTTESEATCSDGIKNQDETGVDCGGSTCQSCSIFVMAGSAISGPVLAGKDFLFGSIPRTIVSTLVLLLLIGGVIAFKILSDKGFTVKEFTTKITKFKDKFLKQKFDNLPKSENAGGY